MEVRYESNIGYIHNDLLSITKYTWGNLNLRKEPNTQSNVITTIPKESRVEVIENIGDWSNIIYNDIEGYVFNYFLSDDGNKHDVLDYKICKSK
ncbi:SH3 domain-containing protein [Clostridium sp. ATCC 25772]|uniref:SH3 domain-containing protein n=1 Tax=Clostridium sp. ATCC 25772 TaxID=1676991 RepID=UPI00078627D7|nr:SH3 domain-containing protein [Clostridium sp. ATCC 25772]